MSIEKLQQKQNTWPVSFSDRAPMAFYRFLECIRTAGKALGRNPNNPCGFGRGPSSPGCRFMTCVYTCMKGNVYMKEAQHHGRRPPLACKLSEAIVSASHFKYRHCLPRIDKRLWFGVETNKQVNLVGNFAWLPRLFLNYDQHHKASFFCILRCSDITR